MMSVNTNMLKYIFFIRIIRIRLTAGKNKIRNLKSGLVDLKIHDILCREITILIKDLHYPGSYEVEFKAHYIFSGIYIYILHSKLFLKLNE